jgi:hypothetical protein
MMRLYKVSKFWESPTDPSDFSLSLARFSTHASGRKAFSEDFKAAFRVAAQMPGPKAAAITPYLIRSTEIKVSAFVLYPTRMRKLGRSCNVSEPQIWTAWAVSRQGEHKTDCFFWLE